jgi:penicillin-binding protein 1A
MRMIEAVERLLVPPDEPTPRRPLLARPRGVQEGLAVLILAATVATGLVGTVWLARHAWAIWRLTRGVGGTVFYGADGRPWFRLDEHRRDVPLDEVSPFLRQAVIAVEDRRFRSHPGIDPIGLIRASWHNVREAGLVEGGSTITQQLARTLFLNNARSPVRKTKEAVLALMLEQGLTKDQILELYLNRVYLSGGVYGVESMSRKLFVKRARDLNLAEAALIAGVIRAPSALSPWSNFEGARERSFVVLAAMREQGLVDADQERAARAARLRITSQPGLADRRSGYAKEYLRQLFRDQVGSDDPPDWQVHTTFLPAVQQAAEQAVTNGLRELGIRGLQAALVALDPETGDVLAMVGGSDFNVSPYNRAVRSRRQPGSAFKPFVYAAALDHGFSPVSVLHDLHSVAAGGRDEWMPRNAEEDTPDSATLREALLESNNQAAVALQQKLGSGVVLQTAAAVGLHDQPNVPSLALGTGLVTPLELTAAYAVFPNGGWAVRPRAIARVLDSDGSVAFDGRVPRRRVLSEPAAFQALTMLQDVIERGTGSSARSLGLRIPAGGKTGTTDEFKDAWFVGFSTSVVAGVWVGFDQPAPIARSAYGARVALPIWVEFMRRVERALPAQRFTVPPGVEEVELCQESYLLPVEGCPGYNEYFKAGDAVPHRLCPIHEGSFRQEARRAVEGLLSSLGRRLRHIFD